MKRSARLIPSRYRQQGVALITALAIVAMAVVAVAAMLHNLQLNVRRTGNIQVSDQGALYTLGSEAWSRGMLIRDVQDAKHKDYDGLDEEWAKELPPTPVEGGQVQALTSDLQARFNLNNLYLSNNATAQDKQRVALELALFQRLLDALGLDPAIAQATADWIDEDINPQFPDGAEDSAYLVSDRPYRTANRPMASPSELRLVRGVTAEAYAKLQPHVTTLPKTTEININTADPLVISALHQDLDQAGAEQLIEDREVNPFKDKTSFIDAMKGLLGQNKVKSQDIDPVISVTSAFYQLETLVRMENDSQRLRSLLYKDSNAVVILKRTFGNL